MKKAKAKFLAKWRNEDWRFPQIFHMWRLENGYQQKMWRLSVKNVFLSTKISKPNSVWLNPLFWSNISINVLVWLFHNHCQKNRDQTRRCSSHQRTLELWWHTCSYHRLIDWLIDFILSLTLCGVAKNRLQYFANIQRKNIAYADLNNTHRK